MTRSQMRGALMTAIGVVAFATSSGAQPANDTYAGRTVVPPASPQFADVVDTTSATTDSDDAELNAYCGFPATDASVWYQFTPTEDAVVVVDASNSSFLAGVVVAFGAPGSFDVQSCDDSRAQFLAAAGETYTLLLVDDQFDGEGHGGTLDLRISQDPAAAAFLLRLFQLPGVIRARFGPSIPRTSFFVIDFEQPVDHAAPDGPTFLQRVTLLHRSEDAPVVLGLDGYDTPGDHTSKIADLSPAAREFVLRKLSEWIGDATLQAARRGAGAPTQPVTYPSKKELFLR